MASFVEKATLLVEDKSSNDIKKINAELNRLFTTANKLRRLNIQIGGVDRAVAQARQLSSIMAAIQRRSLSWRFGGGSLTAITSAVSALNEATKRGGLFAQAGRNILLGFNPGAVGRMIGRGFLYQVGFGLATMTGEAIKEGTKQADIGATRMRQFPFTPAERNAVNQVVDEFVAGQQTINRGHAQQLAAELASLTIEKDAAGQTRVNAEAMRFMFTQLRSLIELQVAQGKSLDDATEAAFNFAKAGNAAGRLIDKTTGNFDPAKAQEFFDALRRTAPIIGEEFTAENVRNFLRNMPFLRQTLSTEAITKFFTLAEEDRTKISTGLESLRQQLAGGQVQKSKVPALQAAGLFKPGTKQLVDQQLFLSDPFAWVQQYIVKREAAINKALGTKFDFGKPEDVGQLTQMLASNRNAQAALLMIINQIGQLGESFDLISRQSGDLAEAQKVTAKSLTLAGSQVLEQVSGFAGALTQQMAPVMIPELQRFSQNFTRVNDLIAQNKFGDAIDQLTGGAMDLLRGPVGRAASAAVIAQSIGTLLDPAASPLNKAAALLAAAAASLLEVTGFFRDLAGFQETAPAVTAADIAARRQGGEMYGPPMPGVPHPRPRPSAVNQAIYEFSSIFQSALDNVQAFVENLRSGALVKQAPVKPLTQQASEFFGFDVKAELVSQYVQAVAVFNQLKNGVNYLISAFHSVVDATNNIILSFGKLNGSIQGVLNFLESLGITSKAPEGKAQPTKPALYSDADTQRLAKAATGGAVGGTLAAATAQLAQGITTFTDSMGRTVVELNGFVVDLERTAPKAAEHLKPLISPEELVVGKEVPTGTEAAAQAIETSRIAAQADIAATFATGATQLVSAGATAASTVEAGITVGGSTAGAAISAAMIAAGGQAGAILAAAVRNAAASITIKAAPAANVGTQATPG